MIFSVTSAQQQWLINNDYTGFICQQKRIRKEGRRRSSASTIIGSASTPVAASEDTKQPLLQHVKSIQGVSHVPVIVSAEDKFLHNTGTHSQQQDNNNVKLNNNNYSACHNIPSKVINTNPSYYTLPVGVTAWSTFYYYYILLFLFISVVCNIFDNLNSYYITLLLYYIIILSLYTYSFP